MERPLTSQHRRIRKKGQEAAVEPSGVEQLRENLFGPEDDGALSGILT